MPARSTATTGWTRSSETWPSSTRWPGCGTGSPGPAAGDPRGPAERVPAYAAADAISRKATRTLNPEPERKGRQIILTVSGRARVSSSLRGIPSADGRFVSGQVSSAADLGISRSLWWQGAYFTQMAMAFTSMVGSTAWMFQPTIAPDGESLSGVESPMADTVCVVWSYTWPPPLMA